jgi:hypothetical protein
MVVLVQNQRKLLVSAQDSAGVHPLLYAYCKALAINLEVKKYHLFELGCVLGQWE